MTPHEFRSLRESMGINAKCMSRVLGVSKGKIHGIESGRMIVTEFTGRAIRWLDQLMKLDPTNEMIPAEIRKKDHE